MARKAGQAAGRAARPVAVTASTQRRRTPAELQALAQNIADSLRETYGDEPEGAAPILQEVARFLGPEFGFSDADQEAALVAQVLVPALAYCEKYGKFPGAIFQHLATIATAREMSGLHMERAYATAEKIDEAAIEARTAADERRA